MGLGTSTLNNIAQWLQIDAFTLLNNSFMVVVTILPVRKTTTLFFIILKKKNLLLRKLLSNQLASYLFVYLNRKQSSKTAIANYLANKTSNLNRKIANNKITLEVLHANTFFTLCTSNRKA
jgi:hypothetical protein